MTTRNTGKPCLTYNAALHTYLQTIQCAGSGDRDRPRRTLSGQADRPK